MEKTLTELADRCETDAPSLELDAAIADATGHDGCATSVGAAAALLPPDWTATEIFGRRPHEPWRAEATRGDERVSGAGETEALARCAANLRAIARSLIAVS